jgi:lysophospholipase L1-like esterase
VHLAIILAAVHWVVTWGTSPAPQDPRPSHQRVLQDQTLHEIVHASIGGRRVRVRFSNLFGADEVRIDAASIGLPGGAPRPLSFGGKPSVRIPANAEVISDPAELDLPALSDVAIDLYLRGPAKAAGIHYGASQTSYVGPGDLTGAAEWPKGTTKATAWAFLAGLDVEAPDSDSAYAVAAFGDSITDGAHSTPNADRRWPDDLARRLAAAANAGTFEIGMLNAGIGGNRLLHDYAGNVAFGVNALSRFDRDVLAQPGVRAVIVLEGINDIGHAGSSAPLSQAVTADDLIAALSQLAARAHELGMKVYAGTLTPFEPAARGYFTPEKEKVREAYNEWIRTTPRLDGCIDFDRATRDPAHPTRFLPAYDSGDHLHPNDAGYEAMAEAVDLTPFRQ